MWKLALSSIAVGVLFAAGSVQSLAAQDTVVVRITDPPLWGASVHIAEDITIGSLEGAEEYVFGAVSLLAGGRDGRTYVYDYQVPVIRQYDSVGRYVRDIGRGGEGPGEYRQLLGMRVLPDGRLTVWDPNLARITVYDTGGRYLASHQLTLGGGLFAADVFQVDAAGNFYIRTSDLARSDPAAFRPGGHANVDPPEVIVRIAPDGHVIDSIPVPRTSSAGSFLISPPEGPRENFPDVAVYTIGSQGGLVQGQSTSYAIDVSLSDGGVRRLVRDVPVVALTSGERDMWHAWAKYFAERPQSLGRQFRSPPKEKPAFRRLRSDGEGRIWVDRYTQAVHRPVKENASGTRPAFDWREPATFDVLDPEGTFYGTVTLPPGLGYWYANGWFIWAVRGGEFGEAYVVRLRIIPERR
jgi:hypothetical protein